MPHRKSADPRSVRAWNEVLVVQAMWEAGRPMRISALAELTELTPATLGQVLRGLEAKGWVKPEGCPERGRGRPAQVYSITETPGCILGFDLGVHAGRVVKFNLEGEELARSEMRLSEPTEENRWQGVADLVGSVLSPEDGPVWLATVASGLIRDQEGRAGDLRPEETHPVEMVRQSLGVETLLCTDVQAETWASHEVGVGHGYGNVVHLHLGRRPKVGLVINDEVHRGVHGVAGSLRVNDLLRGVERSNIPDELLAESGEGRYEIVRAAESGDTVAVAALQDCFELVAPVAGFAAAIVDPDIVVIGGAFTPVAHLGVPALERALAGIMDRPPRVLVSELDQFGTAIGAGLIAHHEIMRTMLSHLDGVAPADIDTFRSLRVRR